MPLYYVGPPVSKQDRSFLNSATRRAMGSSMRARHAAVVASGGRVLSWSHNLFRNHPEWVEDEKAATECSVHAEVAALRKIKSTDLAGVTVYVARVLKNNEPAMSAPCFRCRDHMASVGVKRVVHT